ncbi:hypothetical protein NVP1205O_51 [Vibrio phage 1.205.O._10N.222.51.A7]|nr:hypothetical protein NVP1205O_51 [Vibrio phage 1.205.O._10N.222.51.A7]
MKKQNGTMQAKRWGTTHEEIKKTFLRNYGTKKK